MKAGDENMVRAEHPDESLLSALLDDELSPADRSAVEAHVAACPGCAESLRELESVLVSLRHVGEVPLERDLAPLVQSRLIDARVSTAAKGVSRIELPRWAQWMLVPQVIATIAILAIAIPVLAADGASADALGTWISNSSRAAGDVVADAVASVEELDSRLGTLTRTAESSLGELRQLTPSALFGPSWSSVQTLEWAAVASLVLLLLVIANGALLAGAYGRHHDGNGHV